METFIVVSATDIFLFIVIIIIIIIIINHNVRKCNFKHVRPAKNQIRLRIRAVWSESSLGAFCIAKDATVLEADNEDSDQTALIRRLICVFDGRTYKKVRFLKLRLVCIYLHACQNQ